MSKSSTKRSTTSTPKSSKTAKRSTAERMKSAEKPIPFTLTDHASRYAHDRHEGTVDAAKGLPALPGVPEDAWLDAVAGFERVAAQAGNQAEAHEDDPYMTAIASVALIASRAVMAAGDDVAFLLLLQSEIRRLADAAASKRLRSTLRFVESKAGAA